MPIIKTPNSSAPFGPPQSQIPPNFSKPKNNVVGMFLLCMLFGFVGGLVSLVFFTNQSQELNIPGVSDNTKIIQVSEDSDLIDVVDKVLPSVVSIVSIKNVQGIFGEISQEKRGGTGFVITNDGLILTNKHVVEDTSAEYHVFTNDGKNYVAKVESLDPIMDLAIIKIDAKNLPVIEFGDSNNLQIGQRVVAVGNALGEFKNTVTSGIISAIERTIQATDALGQSTERLDGLLQTDAAINPGNSGGPLINLAGQVIGVNTAVASLSESQGIGFAIPVNFAKTALKSYEKYSEIVRAYLGVRFVPLTPEIAKANDLSAENGALIYAGSGNAAVISGSPASKAGLLEGDIITAINDEDITATKGLVQLLQQYMPGNEIEITYIRGDNSKKVKIVLGELRYK